MNSWPSIIFNAQQNAILSTIIMGDGGLLEGRALANGTEWMLNTDILDAGSPAYLTPEDRGDLPAGFATPAAWMATLPTRTVSESEFPFYDPTDGQARAGGDAA